MPPDPVTGADVVVRPARGADWARCWPLLRAMGQVGVKEAVQQRFVRGIGNPQAFLPVAEQNGALVGYAWAHQGPLHPRAGYSTVRLNDLFVTPAWRRQGVGRQVLEVVIRWATEQGADWLEWQASTAAPPFYARLGYRGDPCPDPEHPFFEIDLASGRRVSPSPGSA